MNAHVRSITKKALIALLVLSLVATPVAAAFGDILWDEDTDPSVGSMEMTPNQETLITVNGDGDITAYDAIEGTEEWSYDSINTRNVEVRGEYIYAITSEAVYKLDYNANGIQSQEWVNENISGGVNVFEYEDYVYTVPVKDGYDGNVKQFDAETGELVDSIETYGSMSSGSDSGSRWYGDSATLDEGNEQLKFFTQYHDPNEPDDYLQQYYVDLPDMSIAKNESMPDDLDPDGYRTDGEYDYIRFRPEVKAISHGTNADTDTPEWSTTPSNGDFTTQSMEVDGDLIYLTVHEDTADDPHINVLDKETGDTVAEYNSPWYEMDYPYTNTLDNTNAVVHAENNRVYTSYFDGYAGSYSEGFLSNMEPYDTTSVETYTVNGTVSDQDGNAIANATVEFDNEETRSYSYEAETNSTGYYEVTNVRSGDYTVTASQENFSTYEETGYEVKENATKDIELLRDELEVRANNWVTPGDEGRYHVYYINYTTDERTEVTENATVSSSDTNALQVYEEGKYQTADDVNTTAVLTANYEGLAAQTDVVVADKCIENIEYADRFFTRLPAYLCVSDGLYSDFNVILGSVIVSSAFTYMLGATAGLSLGVAALGTAAIGGFLTPWVFALGLMYYVTYISMQFKKYERR